jgi:hypothetical protein
LFSKLKHTLYCSLLLATLSQAQTLTSVTVLAQQLFVTYDLPASCNLVNFSDQRASVADKFRTLWQPVGGCFALRGKQMVRSSDACHTAQFLIGEADFSIYGHYQQSDHLGKLGYLVYPSYLSLEETCGASTVQFKPTVDGQVISAGKVSAKNEHLSYAANDPAIKSYFLFLSNTGEPAAKEPGLYFKDPIAKWYRVEIPPVIAKVKTQLLTLAPKAEVNLPVVFSNQVSKSGIYQYQAAVTRPRFMNVALLNAPEVPNVQQREDLLHTLAHEFAHVLQPDGLASLAALSEGGAEYLAISWLWT